MSDNKFLKGAAVLGIAGAVVKILGAFYRIPLGNILGTEGMGYYQTAYPFYVLLLTLSTAGFPVAIAKLVSEKRAVNNFKGAHKVFKVAFVGLFGAGLISSLFVLMFGRQIVNGLGNPNAYYALMGLIPALFFVPMMSSLRGFFQGNQDMKPTAISQIGEQFFRVALGLFFTYSLLGKGLDFAAGGASLGGSVGAVFGTLIIALIYFKNRRKLQDEFKVSIEEDESAVQIGKELLIIAIPITIGSAIVPIMNTIDTLLVLNRLQGIGYSKALANDLYGQLTGFAQTLVNLPQVFSTALAVSLVPAIAQARAKKGSSEIKEMASSGIRVTMLIALPCAFGLFILAEPIINLLYFKNPAETIKSIGELLRYLSISVIFLTLVQSLTAILQGLVKTLVPVKNLFIGAFVKVILTYILTGIPGINIKGAAISTVVAYLIASVLDLRSVKKYAEVDLNTREIFINPLKASLGMMIVAKVSYELLDMIVGGRLATVGAIALAGIAYLILLFVMKAITYDDIVLFPKGDKIAEVLLAKNILKKGRD